MKIVVHISTQQREKHCVVVRAGISALHYTQIYIIYDSDTVHSTFITKIVTKVVHTLK